jgi:hypothetical protein
MTPTLESTLDGQAADEFRLDGYVALRSTAVDPIRHRG